MTTHVIDTRTKSSTACGTDGPAFTHHEIKRGKVTCPTCLQITAAERSPEGIMRAAIRRTEWLIARERKLRATEVAAGNGNEWVHDNIIANRLEDLANARRTLAELQQ